MGFEEGHVQTSLLKMDIQHVAHVAHGICVAHGILLNVMCQPRWEGGLGANGYMYMYG